MKVLKVFLIVALICGTYGCAGMNTTDERILSGGAIGTAAGIGAAAVIGAPLLLGAAAGCAAGAVGGFVVDEIARH
jgi:hypothetical protein